MLETPVYPTLLVHVSPASYIADMDSDNAIGADNQQERLDAYISGYVDGEGSFHVAVQRNPSTRL
jgi:hypothetical protein